MPFGYRDDVEFSRMRVESTQEAATIDALAVDPVFFFGVAIEILHAAGEAVDHRPECGRRRRC